MREGALLFGFRVVCAIVWLYNGLWLKVIAVDAHHLEVVTPLAVAFGLAQRVALTMIGIGETVLAAWILSGWRWKFANWAQVVVVLAMNGAGIFFSGGAVENPVGLLIGNLPLLAVAVALALRGPGWFAWGKPEPK